MLAITLLVAFPCAAFAEQTTAAEEAEPYVILKGESDIEKATDARDKAQAESDKANEKAAALQEQIDDIEEALPAQQARSDAGMKQRYIMQSNPLVYVEAILSVDSLGECLRQIDYLELVSKSNLKELNRLISMKERLNAAYAEQEKVVAEAQAKLDEAQAALQEQIDKRVKAHDDGVAQAKKEASELAAKKAADAEKEGEERDEKQDDNEDEELDEMLMEAVEADTEALDDGIDWSMSRDEFIAEWAPRIDAYLEGSAL
jgi:peptidoglycan hydrolase CwlO-like protein